MAWGLIAGLGGKLIGKAAGWATRQAFGSAAKKVAGGVAVGVATTAIGSKMGGGFLPAPPPPPATFGATPQGGGIVPRPREGIVGRTVSRILPGGMTGYEGVALEGTEYDRYGRPIAVGAEMVERVRAVPGYVVIRNPNMNDGEPFLMLKGAARAMGLWHPKPKPLVSGYDVRAAQRAHRMKKKVKKFAAKVAKL